MAPSVNRHPVRCTRPILSFWLLVSILGFPPKWSKMRGGLSCDATGNFLNWEKMVGGLSESRARWLLSWARRGATAQIADARELRSALGRLSSFTVLLRLILLFMGPLFAGAATMPDGAVRPMPAARVMILSWVADRVEEKPTVTLRRIAATRWRRVMVDAKAEGDAVIVGGFEVTENENTWRSREFSYRLDPVSAPGSSARKGRLIEPLRRLSCTPPGCASCHLHPKGRPLLRSS
jgi:hypothetical protein